MNASPAKRVASAAKKGGRNSQCVINHGMTPANIAGATTKNSAEPVVCVKFSNLTMVPGDAGGEPPVSVAAVAARWVNPLQLLEVELGNGLQLLRQPRCFEAGARRGIGPGGRSVLLQRPPNVAAAAGSAGVAPAAWARDTAEHAAAPGVRLGSSGEGRGAV